MSRKLALIIGNSEYEDTRLARLKAPEADVDSLCELLRTPEIGGFDEVTPVVNQPEATIRRMIARLFQDKNKDDLLLLYFSGHGVLDDEGRLYLAVKDSECQSLTATAIPAAFITDEMDRSRSNRQVLVLDCCHSGAFGRGSKGERAPGARVGTATAFKGSGFGHVVLTATDSTQYAWEGDELIGQPENSIFTNYFIQGLKTGEADTNADGDITLDELYDYIFEQVRKEERRQTPGKWTYRQQGEIVIARNPHAAVKPAELPSELLEAIENPLALVRLGAVQELDRILQGRNKRLALAAHAALSRLKEDYDRRVSAAAEECLAKYAEPAGPKPLAMPKIVDETEALLKALDFGEALRVLEEGLRSYPGEDKLLGLQQSVIAAKAAHERQQAVNEVIQRCEELRRESRSAEALQLVESSLQQYKGEPALLGLGKQLAGDLKWQKRAEAWRKIAAKAREFIGKGRLGIWASICILMAGLSGGVWYFSPGLRAEVHKKLGLALYDKHDWDGAIAEYRQVLRLKPDYAEAHYDLGRALARKGDSEGAIAEFREAIRLKPGLAHAHYDLGVALAKKGDADGAAAELREALRLKPDNAGALYTLGKMLEDKGDLDAAIEEFRKALRLEPDYPVAHYGLGTALYSKGDLDGAIAEYRQAIRLKPDWALAYKGLGDSLDNKGDVGAATAAYREAIRLDPDFYDAHINLGFELNKRGNLDGAEAQFKETLRLNPDYAHAHYNLGDVLEKKGDLASALKEYDAAVKLAPHDSSEARGYKALYRAAYERLSGVLQKAAKGSSEVKTLMASGDRYSDRGEYDKAIHEYRGALKLDPSNSAVRKRLDKARFAKAASIKPGAVLQIEATPGGAQVYVDGKPMGATNSTARVYSFHVRHRHTIGSSRGVLTIGNGRVEYHSDHGSDSFGFSLSEIQRCEKALGGGFFCEVKGDKKYFFYPSPGVLGALQQALGGHSTEPCPSLPKTPP